MSVRMRHTKGHTGNRRSHHALDEITLVKDKETGNLRRAHSIDEVTGMYRGKSIAPAQAVRVAKQKIKGISTEPTGEHTHVHEHAAAEHANAAVKATKSISGKATGGRPKARSGFGGEA